MNTIYKFLTEHQREGEAYAGIILRQDGHYHLFLLPGEAEKVAWEAAMKWAESIGGELPTSREQSLLFANAQTEFEPEWYWSSEEYAPGSPYAWGQGFGYGDQDSYGNGYAGRARAVRRLKIS